MVTITISPQHVLEANCKLFHHSISNLLVVTNPIKTMAAIGQVAKEIALRWHFLGDGLQHKWNDFLDVVGDDPERLWVWGTAFIAISTYWLYAAFFTFMDITNRPKFLRKYKIQPGQNEPVDKKKLWHAIKQVLFIQFVVQIPMHFVIFHFGFKLYNSSSLRVLPSLPTALIEFAGIVVLEELMFYYGHRLAHHKTVYKYVHKKHHEWTAPIAAITFYCHPLEHIFVNLMPIGISVSLMRAHIVTAWVFVAMAIFNSMSDHTGYDFPFSASSVRFHDYHHAKFNYNYGVLGWLDKLHGTFRDTRVQSTNTKKKTIKNGKNKPKTK